MQRIRDLRQYLNTDTPTARAYLASHVEKIVMEPTGRAYVASGTWNPLGEGHWDGAEGAVRSLSRNSICEAGVPFEGLFKRAA
jgi:hypothetical protein